MKSSSQKIKATTQKFIEIENIVDDVVVLSGGQACLVLEVTATNFALQSKDEQQTRILSYAALLNSLSFPIQIAIITRRLDISSYIKLLEQEAERITNQTLKSHVLSYKDFVSELVNKNSVLDKKFYIVIPYSFLEGGPGSVAVMKDKNLFVNEAKTQLRSKASSIIQQLLRVGLKSKILGKNELINLYYEIYNSDPSGGSAGTVKGMDAPIVRSERK